jgi:hypothetical protein
MNSALLTIMLVATGSAAWSAADIGVAPGEPLLPAVLNQSAAPTSLEVGPQGCIVGVRQRVVLRAPKVDRTGLAAADHARAEGALVADWRKHMKAAGVPEDLLDRTTRMPNRIYELSGQEVSRLGCIVE